MLRSGFFGPEHACVVMAQAVDWWEKAAQIAVDEGIDPAEAIGLFQRSENIAGILKSAFRLAADLTPQGQSETSKTSKMSKPSFWAARRSTPSALSARSAHSSSSGHAHACVLLCIGSTKDPF